MTLTLVSLKTKAFSNKTGARPDLDLDRIWLYLMELPAAKTVPPLLLLKALNGAPDLECLPLSLLSKRLAGGQAKPSEKGFHLRASKS